MRGDNDGQIIDDLEKKLESWRERLLDLGNRNPLVNCRFTESSSLIEFDTPSSETIWRTLAAESDAGASVMRFPWRRDLVPPPDDWREYDEASEQNDPAETDSEASGSAVVFHLRKRREWNPIKTRSPQFRSRTWNRASSAVVAPMLHLS